MRRLRYPALAGLGFLLSCATPAPDSPADFTAPPASVVANACPTVDELRLQINTLFPAGRTRNEANNRLSAISKLVKKPDAANAQLQMFRLVEYMLAQYYAHALIGDQSPATQTAVLTLMNGLYCLVGLPAPNLPGSSLGEDGVVAVVGPTTRGALMAALRNPRSPIMTTKAIDKSPKSDRSEMTRPAAGSKSASTRAPAAQPRLGRAGARRLQSILPSKDPSPKMRSSCIC